MCCWTDQAELAAGESHSWNTKLSHRPVASLPDLSLPLAANLRNKYSTHFYHEKSFNEIASVQLANLLIYVRMQICKYWTTDTRAISVIGSHAFLVAALASGMHSMTTSFQHHPSTRSGVSLKLLCPGDLSVGPCSSRDNLEAIDLYIDREVRCEGAHPFDNWAGTSMTQPN